MVFAACGQTLPTRGMWEGDTYSSGYLGLRFELPPEWRVMNTDEMLQTVGLPPTVRILPGREITHNVFNLIGGASFPDVIAYEEEVLPPSRDNGIMIAFFRLGPNATHVEAEILQEMAEWVGGEDADITISPTTARIGRYDWYYAEQRVADAHGSLNQRIFIRLDGAIMQQITVIYHDEASLQDILSRFSAY